MASNSVTFVVGSETFQTSYTIKWRLQVRIAARATGACPHADLHKTHGRPIVLYDQLGTGESTHVCDKPAGFFTPALFVAEPDNLIPWGVTPAVDASYPLWRAAVAAVAAGLSGHGSTHSTSRLGVNEFVMRGVLKDWSVNPKLCKVSCPTLIINGADDAVQDSCVAPLFYGIEKAKWVTLGSMAFWE
ncbi:hypothetical protein EDB85DRAFT_2146382 [Lactarius pseudohatsudake]|nr:hypothetical protein EDB85DRAFT_2146382 [Lactarius pseudohatsudake]